MEDDLGEDDLGVVDCFREDVGILGVLADLVEVEVFGVLGLCIEALLSAVGDLC